MVQAASYLLGLRGLSLKDLKFSLSWPFFCLLVPLSHEDGLGLEALEPITIA